MSTPKMKPDLRAEAILDAAVDVAMQSSVRALTREEVAKMAGISPALVSARMGTMSDLRRKVFRAGVRRGILSIVAEGLSTGVSACKAAPEDLKRQAAAHLIK